MKKNIEQRRVWRIAAKPFTLVLVWVSLALGALDDGAHGPGIPEVGTQFYINNHLGSPSVITNETGEEMARLEYAPYGELLQDNETDPANPISISTGTDNFREKFTGKEWDHEAGLYYYGARYYSPVTGRFTQADDRLGMVDAGHVAALNTYAYAGNQPVTNVDADGHMGGFLRNLRFALRRRMTNPILRSQHGRTQPLKIQSVRTHQRKVSGPKLLHVPGSKGITFEIARRGIARFKSAGLREVNQFCGFDPDAGPVETFWRTSEEEIAEAAFAAGDVPDAYGRPISKRLARMTHKSIAGSGGLLGSIRKQLKRRMLNPIFRTESNIPTQTATPKYTVLPPNITEPPTTLFFEGNISERFGMKKWFKGSYQVRGLGVLSGYAGYEEPPRLAKVWTEVRMPAGRMRVPEVGNVYGPRGWVFENIPESWIEGVIRKR